MATDDLRQYLEERIQALDPTIDVAPGSPADTELITPLMDRLGIDPFSTDIRSFLFARIAEEYPEIDTSGAGSELADLLIGPAQLLFEPFRREVTAVKFSQSLANPDRITRAEASALLSNSFSGLQDGDFSTGSARVYFAEARLVVVDAYTYVSAAGGLRYFAVTAQEFTSQDMALNVEGGLYYIDFDVEAETEGPSYDIGPHELIGVSGLTGVIRVDNKLAFSGGVPPQSLPAALDDAETLVAERSPNTKGGITRKLLDNFSDVRAVQSIGFNDPEMQRDIIKGTVEIESEGLGVGDQVAAGTTTDVKALTDLGNGIALTDYTNLVKLPSVAGITARSDSYPGDVLYIEGDTLAGANDVTRGRHITEIDVGNSEVTVVDFDVIVPSPAAAGTTGSTVNAAVAPQTSAIAGTQFVGAPLMQTSHFRTQEAGQPLVTNVSVGDYLKPDPTSIGSASKAEEIWRIREASSVQLGVSPWVWDYVAGFGGASIDGVEYRVTLADQGGNVWWVDIDAAGGGGPAAGTYDFGNPNTEFGVLNRSPIPASDAISLGDPVKGSDTGGKDWITLYKDLGGGTILHASFLITSKISDRRVSITDPGAVLQTAGPGATSVDGEDEVDWTVLRTPSGETDPTTAFLQSAASGATLFTSKAFGVIRLDANIPDPEDTGQLPPWTAPQTFPFLNPGDTNVAYAIYKQKTMADLDGYVALTLSDIPGGLPDPSVGLEINNDEIHIGGMTDVYVHQASMRQLSVTLTDTKSALLLASGTDLAQPAGGAAADLDADDIGNTTVPPLAAVVLEEASQSYRILRTAGDTITIPEDVDPFAGERYHVVSEVELPLSSMKNIRTSGTNLRTNLHSNAVQDWDFGVNFVLLGVTPGDILDILEGEDKGQYVIDSVKSQELLLTTGTLLSASVDGLSYRVYTAQTSAENPVTRVVKVEMAAGGGTNVLIPYSEPIDIRTTSLENMGQGAKVVGTAGATAVDATVDSTIDAAQDVTRYRFTDASKDFVAAGVAPGDILTIDPVDSNGADQVNAGTYTVMEVANGGNTDELFIKSTPPLNETWEQDAETNLSYSIGTPSVGTARLYFDDPTYIEVPATGSFQTLDKRLFRVDPTAKGLIVDQSGVKAEANRRGNAGAVQDSFRSVGFNFYDYGVRLGDLVTLRFFPIIGTLDATSGFDVKNLTLGIQIEDEDTRTVTFSGTNPILPSIVGELGGMIEQFNEAFADDDIVMELGDGSQGAGSTDRLVIHAGKRIKVLAGTAASLMGFAGEPTNDVTDEAAEIDRTYQFRVSAFLSDEELQLEHMDEAQVLHFPNGLEDKPFKFQIHREGSLIVGPADLEDNLVNGMAYADVEIHSRAAGDIYNLDPGTQLTALGHSSFGWKMRSKLDVETFSDVEETALVLTPLFLRAGREADLTKVDVAAGKDLIVTYDKAETVGFAHSLLLLDEHRVINNNPLARIMLPVYVRMTIDYTGGSAASLVKQDIVDLINSTPPSSGLEVSDIYTVLAKRGAKYVQGPLEIVGVSHDVSRGVQVVRSFNKFLVGRTSHMIADEDNIVVTRS